MAKKKQLQIESLSIGWHIIDEKDYISLTDMVGNSKRPADVIRNWLRNKNTLAFLGAWEKLYNPEINVRLNLSTLVLKE